MRVRAAFSSLKANQTRFWLINIHDKIWTGEKIRDNQEIGIIEVRIIEVRL